MPSFVSLRRPAIYVAMLLPLLALARKGAHGQDSEAKYAAPAAPSAATVTAASAPPVVGTGEQMRAIAVVCDRWQEKRLSEAKTGSKKVSKDGPQDSSDIRDYDFSVTQGAAVYKITLRPKKPAFLKFDSPQGTRIMNNSSTFFYDVRRRDFKIAGVSMIL